MTYESLQHLDKDEIILMAIGLRNEFDALKSRTYNTGKQLDEGAYRHVQTQIVTARAKWYEDGYGKLKSECEVLQAKLAETTKQYEQYYNQAKLSEQEKLNLRADVAERNNKINILYDEIKFLRSKSPVTPEQHENIVATLKSECDAAKKNAKFFKDEINGWRKKMSQLTQENMQLTLEVKALCEANKMFTELVIPNPIIIGRVRDIDVDKLAVDWVKAMGNGFGSKLEEDPNEEVYVLQKATPDGGAGDRFIKVDLIKAGLRAVNCDRIAYFKDGNPKNTMYRVSEVENRPEWFVKQEKKKDYEIQSYRYTPPGSDPSGIMYWRQANGDYKSVNFGKFCPPILVSDELVIYSVKRLSDGEVFTVGDRVHWSAELTATINGFQICNNGKLFATSMVGKDPYSRYSSNDFNLLRKIGKQ